MMKAKHVRKWHFVLQTHHQKVAFISIKDKILGPKMRLLDTSLSKYLAVTKILMRVYLWHFLAVGLLSQRLAVCISSVLHGFFHLLLGRRLKKPCCHSSGFEPHTRAIQWVPGTLPFCHPVNKCLPLLETLRNYSACKNVHLWLSCWIAFCREQRAK